MSDLKGDKNEQNGSLFVVHNITASKLDHMFALGGLAAPSLAIARSDVGFDNFGDISLIGAPALVNPKNRKVRAFAADVYSPRQPRARYSIDKKAFGEMESRLHPAAKSLGVDITAYISPDQFAQDGLGLLEREPIARMAYLMEIGDAPRVVYETKVRPDDRLLRFRGSRSSMLDSKAFADAVLEVINDKIAQVRPGLGEKLEARMLHKVDGIFQPTADTLVDYVDQLVGYRKKSIDTGKMIKAVWAKMDKSKKRKADFNGWLKDNFSRTMKSSYFVSENGRRRPYELELIIKDMTRSLRDGEGWQYGLGSVRSTIAPEFSSLKQMKAASHKIVSPSDFEKVKAEFDQRLFALADKVSPYHGSGKDFGWMDIFCEFVKDVGRGAVRHWQTEIFNEPLSDALMEEVRGFVSDLRDMPAEYFEVKMQRSVRLDEFEAALVVEGTPKETVEHLKNAGLQVVRYKRDDHGVHRRAALEKVKSKVFFERKPVAYKVDPLGSSLRVKQKALEDILPELQRSLENMNIRDVSLIADARHPNSGRVSIDETGGIEILIGQSLYPSRTLNHEVVHVLRAQGLFSEDEWDLLADKAQKDWIARYNIEERYPDFPREVQIEEAIAEAYADHAVGISPHGSIVKAFQRIRKTLVAVKDLLSSKHITTPDQIFEDISSGHIGERQNNPDQGFCSPPGGL